MMHWCFKQTSAKSSLQSTLYFVLWYYSSKKCFYRNSCFGLSVLFWLAQKHALKLI